MALQWQTEGPDKRRGPSLWPRATKNGPKCEGNCSFQHSFFLFVCNSFSYWWKVWWNAKTSFNPLVTELCFSLIIEMHLKIDSYVYRLIGAMLIGFLFNYPFLFWNHNLDQPSHFGNIGHWKVIIPKFIQFFATHIAAWVSENWPAICFWVAILRKVCNGIEIKTAYHFTFEFV